MYYFDNQYLKQYFLKPLKNGIEVFVDGTLYSVPSTSDLDDPNLGIGYNYDGEDHEFDYRAIEFIKIGNVKVTVEDLQKLLNPEEEDDKAKDSEESEDDVSIDPDAPADDKEEKDPKDPSKKEHRIIQGDSVMNEDAFDEEFYKTQGRVIFVEGKMVTYQFYSDYDRQLVSVTKYDKQLKKME